MAENKNSLEIRLGGRPYLDWRGELLAELALARVAELSAHKPKEDCGYDFLVAGPRGVCFFVDVKAFSSLKLGIEDVEQFAEFRWRVDNAQIVRARTSGAPVYLFMFDADSGHGRYLRLDTLKVDEKSKSRTLHFPRENTLDRNGVETILAELIPGEPVASG